MKNIFLVIFSVSEYFFLMKRYDVLENCDVFFKEISEGAFSIQIGSLGEDEDRLVLIAGESVIQVYIFYSKSYFLCFFFSHLV